MHAMDGVPSGTAAWLDARPLLTRHHHIRLGFEPDMARLSRWMAGERGEGWPCRVSFPWLPASWTTSGTLVRVWLAE